MGNKPSGADKKKKLHNHTPLQNRKKEKWPLQGSTHKVDNNSDTL